jgi:hypothetical protein
MALAKYLEDIEDRWHEETAGRYESIVTDLFELFPARPVQAGDVYLMRGGRRMEDIEVCEVGQTLDLFVVSAPETAAPVVEIEDEHGRHKLKITLTGAVTVPFKKAGTRRLQVSSGGYIKPYSIQIVEPFQIEQLPDFAKLIHSLSKNPPQWNDRTFQQFRSQLEAILGKAGVPGLFVSGIIEYHLGLFQEEQHLPTFRQRFEAAYGCLRWFIPYSDIARLICAYYLYCANEFKAATNLCPRRGGRLGRAASFFNGEPLAGPARHQTAKNSVSGLPLLLAWTDVLTFQAIEALIDNRVTDATELAAVIRQGTDLNFSTERHERLLFLEACSSEQSGDVSLSRRSFEGLVNSPSTAIASSAKNHLNNYSHG